MITLALIVLYSLVAVTVVFAAGHFKERITAALEWTHYGPQAVYTKEAKAARDKWEVIQWGSFLWPVELIAAVCWGLWLAFTNGIRWLADLSSRRGKAVRDRKLVLLLEAEREKLLAIEEPEKKVNYEGWHGRLSAAQQLEHVEKLLGLPADRRLKELALK